MSCHCFKTAVSKLETVAAGKSFPSANGSFGSAREAPKDPDYSPRGLHVQLLLGSTAPACLTLCMLHKCGWPLTPVGCSQGLSEFLWWNGNCPSCWGWSKKTPDPACGLESGDHCSKIQSPLGIPSEKMTVLPVWFVWHFSSLQPLAGD